MLVYILGVGTSTTSASRNVIARNRAHPLPRVNGGPSSSSSPSSSAVTTSTPALTSPPVANETTGTVFVLIVVTEFFILFIF